MADSKPVNGDTKPEETPALPPAVLDKYKAAALSVHGALQSLLGEIQEGANVLELCKKGDELLLAETAKVYNAKGAHKVPKGIAYPTSIAVNSNLCHFSPLPSDKEASSLTLQKDDLVKVVLGAHIDGYASLSGETIAVGASSSAPLSGDKANLLQAAYNAVEAGLRGAKVGGKNFEITDGISKILAEYNGAIKGVEGLFSNQHLQNDIQARKTISAFPSTEQRRDSANSFVLEEGDVYHLDVTVTNSASPASKNSSFPTTIFSKAGSKYSLKMKASRSVYSEITNKVSGQFPFSLRVLDEEAKARMGIQECVQHGLLKAYEPLTLDRPTDLAAQILVTFAVTKNGIVKLSHPPVFYSPETVKAEHEVKDADLKALLARPLKPPTKKKNKKAKDSPAAAAEPEEAKA